MTGLLMFRPDLSRAAAEHELSGPDSRWLNLPDARVHYRTAGTGPTVVLLHNSGMWGGVWDYWLPILSEHFTVVVPDLPGAGLTGPAADNDYSMEALTKFVATFVKATCKGPVHVVGLSLGGQLAWRLALQEASLVKSLVLINPTGYPDKKLPKVFKLARGRMGWILKYIASEKMLRNNLSELWGSGAPISAEFLERLVLSQRRSGNRKAFLRFLRTDNKSLHEQIPNITQPVQLQWCEMCGPQQFTRDLPNVELVDFSDFGHIPTLEAPEQTSSAAIRFLEAQEQENA